MGRYRFVDPDVVRLELTDGDWIEVKRHLTVGESRRIAERSRSVVPNPDGKTPVIKSDEVEPLALIEGYLTGWSFVDKRGVQTKPTLDAIKALDQDTYGEIITALGQHITKQQEVLSSDPPGSAPAQTSI